MPTRVARAAALPRGRRAFVTGLGALALAPRNLRADAGHLAGAGHLSEAGLRILVASAAGSGNDATARLFAKVAATLLPRTDVTVLNVDGAGGRLGEKAIWEAPADGLTVAFLRSSIFYRTLQEPSEYPYALTDFGWVGGLSRESRVLVATARSGVTSLEQLAARAVPFTLAADSTTSTRYLVALLVNALLGTRLKPVTGYDGSGVALAAIAGEVDGVFNTFESSLPVIEGAAGRVLLRVGAGRLPAAHAEAPALEDQAIRAEHRWVLGLVLAEAGLGRFVVAPPDTPAERLEALRALLAAVTADPGFLAEAGALGLDVAVTPGADLERQVAALPRPDAETVARFQALLACGLARAEGGPGC